MSSSAIGICQGHGGTQVYNLSQSKTLPEFMAEALKENKSLKKNKDFKERIEVIQGFEFSTTCAKIDISPDRRHIGAIGMYPPDLKVYDTGDLSMKFQRRIDCEAVDFLFLTDDYKKLVLLENDRFLEFHNQGGRHHRMRIPTHGRTLTYNALDAELLITASTDIYRLDLCEGRYKESLDSAHHHPSVCRWSEQASVVGGDLPIIEFFDTRAKLTSVREIDITDEAGGDVGVTALALLLERQLLAAGTSDGTVKIYDMRCPLKPLYKKSHQTDGSSEICDVHFLKIKNDIDSSEIGVASADRWQVKVWRPTSDRIENYATFECSGKINSICPYPESGMIFVAQDFSRVGVHFIPVIGLAPSFCPFVDQIVNDLATTAGSGLSGDFEDFDFITKAELENLQLKPSAVKPYQHGFLIPKVLHKKTLRQKNLLSQSELVDYNIKKHLEVLEQQNPFNIKNIFQSEDSKHPRDVNELLPTNTTNKRQRKKTVKAANSVIKDTRFEEFFGKQS